jgi:hypothetical protein
MYAVCSLMPMAAAWGTRTIYFTYFSQFNAGSDIPIIFVWTSLVLRCIFLTIYNVHSTG